MPSIDSKLKNYNTKTISLRQAHPSDAEFVYKMMQNKDYQKYYLDRLIPKSVEASRKELKKFLKDSEKGNGYYFILEYKGEPAGIMDIYKGHSQDKRAAIGYGLAKEYWGKGIMSKATKILIRFMKKELDFHAVEATAYPKNIASRRVLEKAGFKEIGTMEKYTLSRGKWQDRVLYWKLIE